MNKMVLVLMMVACGNSSVAPAYFGPQGPVTRPDQTVGPPASNVAMTEDGRRLETGPTPKWCYGNAIDDSADCMENAEACAAMRNDHITFDAMKLAKERANVDDVSKATRINIDVAFKVAESSWAPCHEQDHAACFRGHQVVSGARYTLCYTAAWRCDSVLMNQRNGLDLKPDEERCFVFRR